MTHPYFINPDIDALQSAPTEQRETIVRRLAACIGNEAALRSILGIDPEEFARFYPDMVPAELSTEETISSFISLFANDKRNPMATPPRSPQPQQEVPIAAPAINYAEMLDQLPPADSNSLLDNAGDDATADAISSFLAAVPPKTPARKKTTPAPAATQPKAEPTPPSVDTTDQNLSEALFKLMVKNKNYEKALEIITELSLNNPKKSVYFAFQTQFLKKLIKNQQNKK